VERSDGDVVIFSIDELAKARALHGRTEVHGLPISVENRAGSIRRWTARDGTEGKTKMKLPYGYIRGVKGADGDQLDVFVGPNRSSQKVFVVNQRRENDFRRFDEHKCMLGFDSEEEAKKAYLDHFNSSSFLGSITEMSVERFKQWISGGKRKTEPVHKAVIQMGTAWKLLKGLRPPGSGWQGIPGGHKGGYRRKHGADWEYWYPDGKSEQQAAEQPKRRVKPKAPFSEEQLASGNFDHAAAKWSYFSVIQGKPPIGWERGGVDPSSKHPVKEAGRPDVLYQIVERDAQPGWARIKDVDSIESRLVQHELVFPVFYNPNPKPIREAHPPIQEGTPWKPGTPIKKQTFTIKGMRGQKLPRFPDSTAVKGTALHRIENGYFIFKVVKQFETDEDGNARRVTKKVPAVDDVTKMQLLSEFDGLITNAAKKARSGFGLQDRWVLGGPGGKRQNLTIIELRQAAMEGMLEAVNRYKGGTSFVRHASMIVKDYAAMHAADEFAGGIAMPRRHQRILRGFIAAKAESARVLGHTPTADEVLPFWKLKKRDLHEGISNTPQGTESVPTENYKLRASRDGEQIVGEDVPGKREWAERYMSFLDGQTTAEGSEAFEETSALVPSMHIGLGFSAEDKLVVQDQMKEILDELKDHRVSTPVGRRTTTYRADAGDLLMRALGLGGHEQQSIDALAHTFPIESEMKGEWKRLGPRKAHEAIQQMLDSAFSVARTRLGEGRGRTVMDQAKERLLPAAVAPQGPTYGQILEYRGRKVPVEAVRAWRKSEKARLRTIGDGILRSAQAMPEGSHERESKELLARSVHEASDRMSRVSDREVRYRIAQRAAPETAEMRKLATQTIGIEVERKDMEYGHGVATLTDPSTGDQRRVRIRTVRDLRDPENREWLGLGSEYQKSADEPVPTTGLLRDAVRFPQLMRLLTSMDDIPTEYRAKIEKLIGMW
jgi:Inorganic Pyrophosphatase